MTASVRRSQTLFRRAGLSAAIAMVLAATAASADPTASAPETTKDAATPVPDTRPARARPLFSATRRPPVIRIAAPPPVVAPVEVSPPPPPPPPPPPLPQPPPDLRLVGVVDVADRSFAVVRGANADKATTLRKGGRYEGWEVVRIVADRILLREGTREQEYRLFPTALGRAAVVPVEPPPDDADAPER